MKNNVRNRKGFTLTEMIVVLVIIVILIALLVPTLIGYIDKAKYKSVMAEGKMVLTATQTIVSEDYGEGNPVGSSETPATPGNLILTINASDTTGLSGEIATLAEMKAGTQAQVKIVDNKVQKIIFHDADKAAIYDLTSTTDKWTTGKAADDDFKFE
ncbi:prepilin-type N-terminal cleavage/methylation domain-containing protein [Diplocloster hominis]|uniref:prepilin-type N-terminal cleavage/methylation domain-containing protein n=1 Tax=Diplocloster hominis TaxID=3079010 RepID=UPI0031BB9924